MKVRFDATREEHACAVQIAKRYAMYVGETRQTIQYHMDIVACHLNGCPLDLDGLRAAHLTDLVHDMAGIHRHINRDTGLLQNGFQPRYALGSRA